MQRPRSRTPRPQASTPSTSRPPLGTFEAAYMPWQWHGPEYPTVVYHHGSGEHPFEFGRFLSNSFRGLFVGHEVDLPVNIVGVRAPFHDRSQTEYARALGDLGTSSGCVRPRQRCSKLSGRTWPTGTTHRSSSPGRASAGSRRTFTGPVSGRRTGTSRCWPVWHSASYSSRRCTGTWSRNRPCVGRTACATWRTSPTSSAPSTPTTVHPARQVRPGRRVRRPAAVLRGHAGRGAGQRPRHGRAGGGRAPGHLLDAVRKAEGTGWVQLRPLSCSNDRAQVLSHVTTSQASHRAVLSLHRAKGKDGCHTRLQQYSVVVTVQSPASLF